MNINKQVVIQGKTIKVQLEGTGSISTFYGKMNVDKIKERENIVYHNWNIEEKDNGGHDEVQIMFNLNQNINWFFNRTKSCNSKNGSTFSTGSEKVEMARGEVCVFRNNNFSTGMNYEAGTCFNFKSMQMPTPYFRELLSKYFSDKDISSLEEHFLTHVTKTVITPEMYRVLAEIDTADRFKEYEGVYSEGKMIELTALVLYGIAYHKTDEIKRLPQPNKSDVERIELLGALDVIYQQADSFSVKVKAPVNALDNVETRVEGDKLIVNMSQKLLRRLLREKPGNVDVVDSGGVFQQLAVIVAKAVNLLNTNG